MPTPEYWIEALQLEPHPEGGYFREIYRHPELIEVTQDQKRSVATSIYYLLPAGEISHLHHLKSDEIWFFHAGDPVLLHLFNRKKRQYQQYHLGADARSLPQLIIPAEIVFGAEVTGEGYSLVGCVVVPGFQFDDFRFADKRDLIRKFPDQTEVLDKMCKSP